MALQAHFSNPPFAPPTGGASAGKAPLLLTYPIANFATGITKKPFGIYITPKTSPVQPERFTGFHTGVDVEQNNPDPNAQIPVFAIADAVVVYSGWVSGYGGVLGLKFSLDGENYYALYGHLNVATLPKTKTAVKQGETVGYLGKGYTQETDYERRHLHFGIITGSKFDLRGYVQNKSELSGWTDPVAFFTRFR